MSVPSVPDLLARLVAFDTTSRRSNLPCVDFLCDLLDRPGVELRRLPSPDGEKAGLLARVGPAVDHDARAGLVLCGHLDVVPAEEDGWSSDPFVLSDRGNRWVGRGACDMKGSVALAAHRAATLDPASLAAPLVLLLTYDEELGSLGAQQLVRAAADLGPLPRACLVGEPTSLAAVRLHKGHLRMRIVTHGRAAHSGFPHRGANAVEALGRAIAALADLRRALEAERVPSSEHFPEIPFVALNQARVRGGDAVNVIPDRATLDLGLRPLPGMDPDELAGRVRAAVAEVLRADQHEVIVVNDSPPLETPADAPLHRTLAGLLGQEETVAASFSSDGGTLARLGLDCVLFGPGSIEVAHRPDEYLPKDELERAGEVVDELIDAFCREGGP